MAPRNSVGSSSQVPRRRAREEEEEVEEDDDDNEEYEEEVNGGGATQTQTQRGNGGLSDAELKRKASQLAKFALLMEYKRHPIRRADAQAKIMPGNSRAFPAVLASAQVILRNKFGMELVELRKVHNPKEVAAAEAAKGKAAAASQTQKQKEKEKATQKRQRLDAIAEEEEDEDEDDEEEGVEEEQAAAAAKKEKKVAGTGSYILQPILSPDLLQAMSIPNPLPMFDERGRRTQPQDEDNPDSGALIPWEKADGTVSGSVGLLGVRTLILCLIMCVGRVIEDDHLHALLSRLNLHRDTILPYASKDSPVTTITLDKYLDILQKQNYLEKRTFNRPGAVTEIKTIEWRWGSREVEFSEKAMAKWVQEVMIDSRVDTFEDEGAPRRNGQERRTAANARERLRKDLVKAAGSALTGKE